MLTRYFEKTDMSFSLALIYSNHSRSDDGGSLRFGESLPGYVMDYLLDLVTNPTAWAALVTLIVMEIVLGIDNLIFISILSNKLPAAQRVRAQRTGLLLAL